MGWAAQKMLASAVAGTRPGRSFEHEDFWLTVLQLFVNEPTHEPFTSAPSWTISTVSDSSRRRFSPGNLTWDNLPSSSPDLTTKARTEWSLLRQVEEWQTPAHSASGFLGLS